MHVADPVALAKSRLGPDVAAAALFNTEGDDFTRGLALAAAAVGPPLILAPARLMGLAGHAASQHRQRESGHVSGTVLVAYTTRQLHVLQAAMGKAGWELHDQIAEADRTPGIAHSTSSGVLLLRLAGEGSPTVALFPLALDRNTEAVADAVLEDLLSADDGAAARNVPSPLIFQNCRYVSGLLHPVGARFDLMPNDPVVLQLGPEGFAAFGSAATLRLAWDAVTGLRTSGPTLAEPRQKDLRVHPNTAAPSEWSWLHVSRTDGDPLTFEVIGCLRQDLERALASHADRD